MDSARLPPALTAPRTAACCSAVPGWLASRMAAEESGANGAAARPAPHPQQPAELVLQPTLKSTHQQMRACLSVDLLTACQREVNFLRMIDRKAPVLYEKAVVENAIRRYETFWLPMQAQRPDLNNIPPLDVHWIWHTHMLSPASYEEVGAAAGAPPPHSRTACGSAARWWTTSCSARTRSSSAMSSRSRSGPSSAPTSPTTS